MAESKFREIKFTDKDVIADGFIPAGESNPHGVRPWLLHDHGQCICVVFASNLQDALDEAVDNDKLDHYQIDPRDEYDRDDYMTNNPEQMAGGFDVKSPEYVDENGVKYWWRTEPTFLGNADEPFDIDGVEALELPNPPMSFCVLFNAAQAAKGVK